MHGLALCALTDAGKYYSVRLLDREFIPVVDTEITIAEGLQYIGSGKTQNYRIVGIADIFRYSKIYNAPIVILLQFTCKEHYIEGMKLIIAFLGYKVNRALTYWQVTSDEDLMTLSIAFLREGESELVDSLIQEGPHSGYAFGHPPVKANVNVC